MCNSVIYSLNLQLQYLSLLYFQGIEYLIENDLIKPTPDDVAEFLHQGEGLNKTAIGDYLGEKWVQMNVDIYSIMGVKIS